MVDHEGTNENGAGRNYEEEYSRLSERERTLPSGFVVRFRALGIGEWVAIWRSVPSLIRAAGTASETVDDSTANDVIEKSKLCVIAASVSPLMHNGDPQSLRPDRVRPPGCMSVLMLSDVDLADYMKGITEALGFGTKKSEVASDVVNS